MAVPRAKSALDVTSGVMPRLTGWFDLELGRAGGVVWRSETARGKGAQAGVPAPLEGSWIWHWDDTRPIGTITWWRIDNLTMEHSICMIGPALAGTVTDRGE